MKSIPIENEAKLQHYVPQFLLRKFEDTDNKIHVFDKQLARQFATISRNIGGENRFYNFELNGKDVNLEPFFFKVEGDAARILEKINYADSLADLTIEERAQLSVFFSIQFVRTRGHRERFREAFQRIDEKLKAFARTDEKSKKIKESLPARNAATTAREHANQILLAPEKLAFHFANKVWILISTDLACPFIIGDNPLTLHNRINPFPFGNLGLAVLGIEIFFPISPVRALVLLCPSYREKCLDAASKFDFLMQRVPHLVPEKLRKEAQSGRIEKLKMAIESGCALPYLPEGVKGFNSLQISFSERFLYSSNNNFTLVTDLIASEARFRNGPRFTVG